MKKKYFYSKIQLYLKITQSSYSNYIESEKKFIYTKVLRKYNGLLLNHLIDNPEMIDGDNFDNFVRLIQHLSIWIEKWDFYVKKDNPSINEKFVFENESTFPRDFTNNLMRIKLSEINL